MSTKKPALTTQLKTAKARIEELEKELSKAQEKLKSSEASKDSFYKQMQEAQGEIEQVHALLDALPGSAGRKTDDEECWRQKDIRTMTRLAAYLANRA